MSRFGAITVARWLSEKLPPRVKAYVELDGKLFELLAIQACNAKIKPTLRTLLDDFGRFTPTHNCVQLDTIVVLSLGENLAGVDAKTILSQTVPAAIGSWALPLGRGEPKVIPEKILDDDYASTFSMFCG